jgi:hypothetical protein
VIAPAHDDQHQGAQAHAITPADQPVPEFIEPDKLLAVALRFRKSLGIVESRISGYSMRSTLPAGSRIRIQCCNLDRVRRGTVVAFVGGSSLIAHRVVRRGRGPRSREVLLTRGDATIICDTPIHADKVLGVVTHVATGDRWGPLPSPSRGLVARVAAGFVSGAMTVAMELDTRAARAVAATCFQVRSVVQRVKGRVRRLLVAE